MYIVGKFFACIEHKDKAFEMQKKQKRPTPLPEVGFEPEIEALEVQEVEVGRFAKLAAQSD